MGIRICWLADNITRGHSLGYCYQHCNYVQLISAVLENSVLRVTEIYALENVVFYIAVNEAHKPYISQTEMFKRTWNQLYV